MLQKKLASYEDLSGLTGTNAVVSISTIDQAKKVDSFYKSYKAKIRGVQLSQSLVGNIDSLQNINYYSIIINNENIDLSNIQGKNTFIELQIPIKLFSTNLNLRGVHRVILLLDSEKDLQLLDVACAELIGERLFPFTKGIPFCRGNIDQMYELFYPLGPQKRVECKQCSFAPFCSYNGPLEVKPISEPYEDALEFLEKNENATNRL